MTFKRFLLGHTSRDALAVSSLPTVGVEFHLEIDLGAWAAATMKPRTANDQ